MRRNTQAIAPYAGWGILDKKGLTAIYKAGFPWQDSYAPTQHFVGSYTINIYPNADLNGMATYVLKNTSSVSSFNPFGFGEWNRSTLKPLGNMSQTFIWQEKIPGIKVKNE